MRGNIFINYRRDDSAGWTGRLHDRLRQSLPPNRIFIDVDNIEPGQNFTKILDAQVGRCDVLLAMIGPRWLTAADENGRRRINNPADFVRIEIASALRRDNVHVIPVLVDGAQMPSANDLPEDLKALAHRNALEVSGKRFHRDCERLITAIKRELPFRVRHHRAVRNVFASSIVGGALTAVFTAIYVGLLPNALGLESLIRPAAREWAGLTYEDKTNPATMRDFLSRYATAPEHIEAERWFELTSARAWSKVKDTGDPHEIDDFLLTFRDSPEVKEARARLDVLRVSKMTPVNLPSSTPLMRFRDCSQCPEMVSLPSGSFTMGSLDSERTISQDDHEGPRQVIKIARPFAAGRFHVTVAEFKTFVKETGYTLGNDCLVVMNPSAVSKIWEYIPGKTYLSPGFEQADDHPVVCVNWHDAQAYLKWLSAKTGGDYRLLTEAEWEYSARAGSQDRYFFGDNEGLLCQHANGADRSLDVTWLGNRWCSDGKGLGTVAAGSYLPNRFGLRDMLGNAHQWVSDCYHNGYEAMPEATKATGEAWVDSGCAMRVIRGGCWAYPPTQLRSARREAWASVQRSFCVGFRVAKTLAN